MEQEENIREQDPLKQGLKLAGYLRGAVGLAIREQDPLKQGLKLKSPTVVCFV